MYISPYMLSFLTALDSDSNNNLAYGGRLSPGFGLGIKIYLGYFSYST